jgi:hypothetical protein
MLETQTPDEKNCRLSISSISSWQLKIGNRKSEMADSASHIEQAQPRQPIFFQQTFVYVLLLQLLDLC